MAQGVAQNLLPLVICGKTGFLNQTLPTIMDSADALAHELDNRVMRNAEPVPTPHVSQQSGRQWYRWLLFASRLFVVRLALEDAAVKVDIAAIDRRYQ
jgi:hypothetical protein